MMDRFERNLRLGYGFSLFILLSIGIISYMALNSLVISDRAVTRSSDVIQKLDGLLSVMKDAETGQRGYLLSGKTTFLEPYHGAGHEAGVLEDELKILTHDNPEQQRNITVIDQILRKRLGILQQLIDKKQRGELVSGDDLEAGKQAMDALRQAVSKAKQNEQVLLQQQQASFGKYVSFKPVFIIAGVILALCITFYSYRNVISDMREKERLRAEIEQGGVAAFTLNNELKAANEGLVAINEKLSMAREQLAAANENLEQKVAERTEELKVINGRLQQSLDELRLGEERSAKLAAIVESSDDAIIGKDLNGIITAWNRGARQIFGYSEDEVIGQSVLKLIPEDRQHEEPVILGRLRKGERIDHYETIRQRKDGQLIDVSLTISPIHDKEGKVTGVSKIARDITEQKRDEQRKNDFIGMASHELKTPLTSLMALIQTLQRKLATSPDEFVPTALNKAVQQTRKMTSLINGFLNISRLESSKMIIEKQEFDLAELAREMVDDIQMTVTAHSFELDAKDTLTVMADKDKIGSVISNFLSNAVKYSPKGKFIKIKCERHENEAWVSVQDEGMGIRAEDRDKIFDRYYRVKSEHTNNIAGFGIGLYLSAEIIQRHDGRVWLESEKGVGSTFHFSLPLA